MSEKREKRRRYILRAQHRMAWDRWRREEPPKWRIIRHYLWKQREPKLDLDDYKNIRF